MKLSTAIQHQPFQAHKKKRTKFCATCQRHLPVSCFFLRKESGPGKRRSPCKECMRTRNRARHPAIYAGVQALKDSKYLFVFCFLARHPCVDCGEGDFRVLDFDHIDPNDKSEIGGVAQLLWRNCSLKRIKAEIEKCEIVCSNCHRIRTAERANNVRWRLYEQVNEEVNS